MTIAHSLLFNRKAWTFPSVPGLPAGVWSATNREEGDASGGSITFQHIFSSPGNDLGDSNIYSIEQVSFGSGDNGLVACSLTLNGMDVGSGAPGTPADPITRSWNFAMEGNDVGVGGTVAIDIRSVPANFMNPHIWVGTYQGIPTDFGDVLIRAQNPTASFVMGAALYGYWWTPDAINAAGGLRRPPEYFFSP